MNRYRLDATLDTLVFAGDASASVAANVVAADLRRVGLRRQNILYLWGQNGA